MRGPGNLTRRCVRYGKVCVWWIKVDALYPYTVFIVSETSTLHMLSPLTQKLVVWYKQGEKKKSKRFNYESLTTLVFSKTTWKWDTDNGDDPDLVVKIKVQPRPPSGDCHFFLTLRFFLLVSLYEREKKWDKSCVQQKHKNRENLRGMYRYFLFVINFIFGRTRKHLTEVWRKSKSNKGGIICQTNSNIRNGKSF